MRRSLRAVAITAVLALGPALAGCAEGADPPGPAQVDVDTPQLRALKAEAGVAACEPTDAEPVDGGLPEVTLACLGGGPEVDLAGLRGPMVVNFWAAWCGPCRREMPVLQEFHERYADRVALVGVDYNDPQPQRALELVAEAGVTYPLLADPQEAVGSSGDLRIPGLPVTALVDEQGRVAHLEAGEIDSVAELADLVEQHLGVRL